MSNSFIAKLRNAHFAADVQNRLASRREIISELPGEGSFADGRQAAENVQSRCENLLLVNIREAGLAISEFATALNVLSGFVLKARVRVIFFSAGSCLSYRVMFNFSGDSGKIIVEVDERLKESLAKSIGAKSP